jgi:type II secretory pathway pseudopilin PulG
MKTQPGFTLLETVIALLLGIVVLGASVTVSRTIQQNAALGEVRLEQQAVLNQAVDLITLTRQQNPSSTALSSLVGSSIGAAYLRILPYRTGSAVTNEPVPLDAPMQIAWCSVAATCNVVKGYVGVTAGTAYTGANALSPTAEIVAIRKGAPSTTPIKPQLLDFSHQYTTLATPILGYTTTTGESANYNYYRRGISVRLLTEGSSLYYQVKIDVAPIFNGTVRTGETITRILRLAVTSALP